MTMKTGQLGMQVAALLVSLCLEKIRNTFYPGPEAYCGDAVVWNFLKCPQALPV